VGLAWGDENASVTYAIIIKFFTPLCSMNLVSGVRCQEKQMDSIFLYKTKLSRLSFFGS
jgi:hypothetical protein